METLPRLEPPSRLLACSDDIDYLGSVVLICLHPVEQAETHKNVQNSIDGRRRDSCDEHRVLGAHCVELGGQLPEWIGFEMLEDGKCRTAFERTFAYCHIRSSPKDFVSTCEHVGGGRRIDTDTGSNPSAKPFQECSVRCTDVEDAGTPRNVSTGNAEPPPA